MKHAGSILNATTSERQSSATGAIYHEHDLQLFDVALDLARRQLSHVSKTPLIGLTEHEVDDWLAQSIMDRAAAGERNPERLATGAVQTVLDASQLNE